MLLRCTWDSFHKCWHLQFFWLPKLVATTHYLIVTVNDPQIYITHAAVAGSQASLRKFDGLQGGMHWHAQQLDCNRTPYSSKYDAKNKIAQKEVSSVFVLRLTSEVLLKCVFVQEDMHVLMRAVTSFALLWRQLAPRSNFPFKTPNYNLSINFRSFLGSNFRIICAQLLWRQIRSANCHLTLAIQIKISIFPYCYLKFVKTIETVSSLFDFVLKIQVIIIEGIETAER